MSNLTHRVLSFWFKDLLYKNTSKTSYAASVKESFKFDTSLNDNTVFENLMKFWYYSSETLDSQLKALFQQDLQHLSLKSEKELVRILEKSSPADALAYIVCLDQFSRNIYRYT